MFYRELNWLQVDAFHDKVTSILMINWCLVNRDFPLFLFYRIVLLVLIYSHLTVAQVTYIIRVVAVVVVATAVASTSIVIIVIILSIVRLVILSIVVVRLAYGCTTTTSTSCAHRRCIINFWEVRIRMPRHGKTIETLHIEWLARVVTDLTHLIKVVKIAVLALSAVEMIRARGVVELSEVLLIIIALMMSGIGCSRVWLIAAE